MTGGVETVQKKRNGVGVAADLAAWLDKKCRTEGLSYRQAAAKAKLSHATIAAIRKGSKPSGATIVKLAKAFSPEGTNQYGMLEDYLLGLCGFRSRRPETVLNEQLARLLDKLSKLDEKRLGLIEYFVDFSATLGDGSQAWRDRNL